MYTSDQGFFLGDHGWYDKRFMYEESLRMPFMVRYPKEIKAGTVVKEIATNVDLPATFVDWAEIKTPEYFQGYSLRPLTKGEIPEDWQQSMYYRYWMHLSHHDVGAHYGVRTKTFKLIYYYGKALGQPFAIDSDRKPEWELFDLEKDPFEVQNVYHNPEYASKVTELKNELHRLQEKVGDTPEVEIN
jgi:arylsulfatase A-like enzyme